MAEVRTQDIIIVEGQKVNFVITNCQISFLIVHCLYSFYMKIFSAANFLEG